MKMKVKELIEELKKHDQDLEVMTWDVEMKEKREVRLKESEYVEYSYVCPTTNRNHLRKGLIDDCEPDENNGDIIKKKEKVLVIT